MNIRIAGYARVDFETRWSEKENILGVQHLVLAVWIEERFLTRRWVFMQKHTSTPCSVKDADGRETCKSGEGQRD